MKNWMYISSAADKDLFRRLRDSGVTGVIGSETARAIRERKGAAVLPTLQLGDPLLAESIRAARQAGAADLAFFAYSPQHDAALRLL